MKLTDKDVRIGNIVWHAKLGLPVEITWAYLRDMANTPLSGIPLSDKWLMELGFEVINHIHEGKLYKKDWLRINASLFTTDWRGGHIANKPKYVHTLQNLYHALKGEELIYTPKQSESEREYIERKDFTVAPDPDDFPDYSLTK